METLLILNLFMFGAVLLSLVYVVRLLGELKELLLSDAHKSRRNEESVSTAQADNK